MGLISGFVTFIKTGNPLFFKSRCQIWSELIQIEPSKLKNIVAFFPSHATKRVTAQSGMFTIHPTKCMNLESDSIKKIVIPASRKKYFLEKLVKYGVHHATIFPDLDGLSSYIKHQNDYR